MNARDTHGEVCLGDPRFGPFLRQQVQILNAAVQHI